MSNTKSVLKAKKKVIKEKNVLNPYANAKELACVLLESGDRILENHYTDEHEFIPSERALADLSVFMQQGLILHNYIIKHSLFKTAASQNMLVEVEKLTEKLQMDEEHAKKLDLKSGVAIWLQLYETLLALGLYFISTDKEAL